ncbi:mitochondrial potassium channel-like [Onthophagus taurus]|uniref:mitochondrial potassium channel-like n=1 Tax=Onthophagus taurus TaxID=166361 RepID=UPI000C20154D|nr:coiled-coil domain-containing protein 51-like [Onthophagus taurus]
MRFLSTNIVKTFSNNLNLTVLDAPKLVSHFKEKIIYKKVNDLNSWYTRVIGLDEVKLYQDRVVDLQDKLLTAQERRREMGFALSLIRKKSNELQDRLHKVKRQDDLQLFLDLMREETEILKQEREVQDMFVNYDREEREIFTAFANAIRDSHEKQRSQVEYTKYLGLILSILGSFLGFAYSSIRKDDLKKFIEGKIEEISSKQLQIEDVTRKGDQNYAKLVQKLDENTNRIQNVERNDFNEEFKDFVDTLPDQSTIIRYTIYALVGYTILRIIM